ncbi:hypothetical protein [uncultured Tyzzerella sp.]|uniref:hypothetical protein n=1 Tax=uncultured Tyzzerella sp. TaxID=2321398 RepID=UPI0029424013|nr:hypothetical protein [uncultured Tyzzerella sp.]
MNLLREYEENGYKIEEYDNGTTVKKPISQKIEEIVEKKISKQEISNAQILNKLDYIECLAELNSMKGGNL